MARRTFPLDVTALRAVRPQVGTCLRWKYDWVSVERTSDDRAGVALEAWVRGVKEHWGVCGQVLEVDEEPRAYVLYAPPAFLPGLGDVPTAPPSPDAVVLAEMCLLPGAGGFASAKHLVQTMARDLHAREVAAVEAFGRHTANTAEFLAEEPREEGAAPGERCLVPVDFLDAVGFTTHRAHGTTPRMRMELRGARTWKSEVELALERLVGVVRPVSKPRWSKPGLGSPAVEPETPLVRSGPRAP